MGIRYDWTCGHFKYGSIRRYSRKYSTISCGFKFLHGTIDWRIKLCTMAMICLGFFWSQKKLHGDWRRIYQVPPPNSQNIKPVQSILSTKLRFLEANIPLTILFRLWHTVAASTFNLAGRANDNFFILNIFFIRLPLCPFYLENWPRYMIIKNMVSRLFDKNNQCTLSLNYHGCMFFLFECFFLIKKNWRYISIFVRYYEAIFLLIITMKKTYTKNI